MVFPRRLLGCATAAATAALAACSPVHDWRDVRPADTQAVLQFPCRPVLHQRTVPLAGPAVQLSLLACTAGGQTWALAHADLADPLRVGPALVEMRDSAAAKLKAIDGPLQWLAVPGATPNVHSGRGRLGARPSANAPESGALQMELLLFAHGTRVFQASVLGQQLPADEVDTFFASIGFRQ